MPSTCRCNEWRVLAGGVSASDRLDTVVSWATSFVLFDICMDKWWGSDLEDNERTRHKLCTGDLRFTGLRCRHVLQGRRRPHQMASMKFIHFVACVFFLPTNYYLHPNSSHILIQCSKTINVQFTSNVQFKSACLSQYVYIVKYQWSVRLC